MLAWICYCQKKEENDILEMYARRIQKLEKHLGRAITDFSNWGIE